MLLRRIKHPTAECWGSLRNKPHTHIQKKNELHMGLEYNLFAFIFIAQTAELETGSTQNSLLTFFRTANKMSLFISKSCK